MTPTKARHFQPRNQAVRILLALGVAAGLAFTGARAQTWPMPNAPFDGNPGAHGSPTSKLLTYGTDADGNQVPLKTLRITNNTSSTVYPIMRNPNSSVIVVNSSTVGQYDPYDPPNMEYRGYIGYQQGSSYFFGLQPGQSILVTVPLVFWNGGRVGVGTDGKYLTAATNPNPQHYDPNAMRTIAPALSGSNTISNGVVMWYRAGTAKGPAPDAEDQLAEWTFRDHPYLVNPQITKRTKNQIPDNQLVTLANIDVSFVDSLYLPLAFEALDAWVLPQASGTGPTPNRSGWKPGSDPEPFGWTGAVNDIKFLQDAIKAFTQSGSNAILGNYFGGKGWPFYNIPNPGNNPNAPMKIPSGANVFALSPLLGIASSYNDGVNWQTNKYLLSSGGTTAIQVTIPYSGVVSPAGSSTISLLNSQAQKALWDTLAIGDVVTANTGSGGVPSIKKGTTLTGFDFEKGYVDIKPPLIGPSLNTSYTFSRPVDDYATDTMVRIWYSWAEYYRQHWKDKNTLAPTTPTPIKGSIKAGTATMTFSGSHPELVEGMMVTGPGLDNAQTEVGLHQGNALILKIANDTKSIIISQVSNKTTSGASYTFSPPQKLLYTPAKSGDTGYPLLNLTFNTTQEWREPYAFSQTVYKIMASINQIGKPNNGTICKYMEDIIGANMGYIFETKYIKQPDVQMVIAMIRDMIKSSLRGVSDFTEYPDIIESGTHKYWYPDPTQHTGGQTYNVFNLDPFVRFVHVNLGFSGYGFSVDDDTADIGAGGTSHLQLSITGTGGLINANEWTIQAPYGPVTASCSYSGTAQGDTLYNAITNASDTTPIKITSSGRVQLKEGGTVIIDQVNGNKNANGTYMAKNVATYSFDLWSLDGKTPIVGSGTYSPTPTPGRWSYPPHPYIDTGADLSKVFYRVTGDDALGTFQGTPVNVDNVSTKAGEKVRVWQLGQQSTGRLLLNAPLLGPSGIPLAPGTYQFTFSSTYNNPGK